MYPKKFAQNFAQTKHFDNFAFMKETLTTISQRTGISASTISRVLSGNAAKYRISKCTANKVLSEAQRCNYRQGFIIQSMLSKRSGMIGLVLPSLSNPYFSEMAHVAISALRAEGYSTIVADTMEDEKTFRESIAAMIAGKVDGMLVAPCGDNPQLLESIENNNIPIVLIDRFYKNSKLSFVTTNNYQGGVDATRYLISKGHRRIVCIKGVGSSLPNQERLEGYEQAMNEAGLGEYITSCGNDFTVQNGYEETLAQLQMKEKPTAIFSLGNTIAMGAIKAIREMGLRIPDDISIITFDNNMYLDYLTPSIVRIGQPVNQMTTLATKILLDKIRGTFTGSSHLRLSPTLINGESVRDNY